MQVTGEYGDDICSLPLLGTWMEGMKEQLLSFLTVPL